MSDIVIVKVKDGINIKADMMRYWRNEIIMQKETGVILLPWYLTAIAVPEDTELKIESEEQERCEDAISRQAVFKIQAKYAEYMGATKFWQMSDDIKALPPVTPQPKTGYWITWKEAGNEISSETRFECSVCHDAAQTLCNGLDLLSSFCPNCGARMVDPQERSDKE